MRNDGVQVIRPGDHLAFQPAGGIYSHHAIYVGDGLLAHYWDPQRDLRRAVVRVDPLHVVAAGAPTYVIQYSLAHEPALVVQRALSRRGERDYHLAANNCEAFAR